MNKKTVFVILHSVCLVLYSCVICPSESDLIIRPLGYERVYLSLYKVADTPFHIQGDELPL